MSVVPVALVAKYEQALRLRRRTVLGKCASRGLSGVGVLVNTHLAMNIYSYESLTSRIRRLRLKRCGSVPALTVFVEYAPTSDYYDKEVEGLRSSIKKITPSTR
ncbi:unnamed protein product [Heligmosomoides polygyrus]|uniref:UmuC domain-containing protein n=1 Tax=Heligmosomoides polygyrus TaxID=6339 RepID=A0A183GE46_HELPZ|nr:unnamed protein product [Heligmosomoides polygyrus]